MEKRYKNLRIEETLHAELKKEAIRQETSMVNLMSKALREYILKQYQIRVDDEN